MKKFLVVLASVIVAALTLSLTTSCKNDMDLSKSLVGTKWSCQVDSYTYTLTFDSETACTMEVKSLMLPAVGHSGSFKLTGSRSSLKGERITITYYDWEDGSNWDTGKFDSETELRLENIVFTKI